jgi:hypothetical protein
MGICVQKVLFVGTTFLDPEEQLPSKGRLLILDETNLTLLQEFSFEGSIQAICFTYDNRYLIVGLNFTIQAFQIQLALGQVQSHSKFKRIKLEL